MTDPIIVTRSCPYCDWGMEVTTTSSLFALAQGLDLEDRLLEHIKQIHPNQTEKE